MGNSPKRWAVADLDPISPLPVHPSSPVLLPILHDRADTCFNMSSSNNTFEASPEANAPVAAQVNEQPHAPTITRQNNAPNTVPVDNGAEHMQEPETSDSVTTDAKQDVSTSNGVVYPALPPLEGNRTDIVAPTNGNGLSAPQLPVNVAPASLNTPQNSKENSRPVLDAAISNLIANLTQPSSNTRATAVGAARIHNSDTVLNNSLRPQNTSAQNTSALPAKPPVHESTRVQACTPAVHPSLPGAAQPSNIPSISGDELGANDNEPAVQRSSNPYFGATSKQSIIPVPNHTAPPSQPGHIQAPLPVGQSPLVTNRKQQWETFTHEERNYVSEAQWSVFPEGSRIFIGL